MDATLRGAAEARASDFHLEPVDVRALIGYLGHGKLLLALRMHGSGLPSA